MNSIKYSMKNKVFKGNKMKKRIITLVIYLSLCAMLFADFPRPF